MLTILDAHATPNDFENNRRNTDGESRFFTDGQGGSFATSLIETYKLIQSRAIAHYRVGPGKGAIRIDTKEVTAFLEKRRVGFEERKPMITPIRAKPLKHIRKNN